MKQSSGSNYLKQAHLRRRHFGLPWKLNAHFSCEPKGSWQLLSQRRDAPKAALNLTPSHFYFNLQVRLSQGNTGHLYLSFFFSWNRREIRKIHLSFSSCVEHKSFSSLFIDRWINTCSSKRFRFNGNLEDMLATDREFKTRILVHRIVCRSTSTGFRTHQKKFGFFSLIVLNWYFEIYETARIHLYSPGPLVHQWQGYKDAIFKKAAMVSVNAQVFPIRTVYLHYLDIADICWGPHPKFPFL